MHRYSASLRQSDPGLGLLLLLLLSLLLLQAVHTPYDAVPFNPTKSTYQGMLWDSDVYIGAITNMLRAKQMYERTLIVYSGTSAILVAQL